MPEPSSPIRPEDSIAKMIASLKEKTGKSIEEWKDVISQSGWLKHGEIMNGLKLGHGVSHAYANQIALHVRSTGSRDSEEPGSGDPLAEIFAKRPEAKLIYDALLPRIQAFGTDVDLAPKKGYVSVRRKKQFAILQPASGRLDVGIQLKGVAASGRLEPSGSFNAMLTHRVRVSDTTQVDKELVTG